MNKKPKVAIVGNSLSPHVTNRWQRLSKSYEIESFFIDSNLKADITILPNLNRLSLPSRLNNPKIMVIIRFIYSIIVLYKLKADVIFVMYADPLSLLSTLLFRGRVVISTWGGDLLEDQGALSNWYERCITRKALSNSDCIFCVSKELVERVYVITGGKVKSSPRHLIYGLDTTLYSPVKKDKKLAGDFITIYSARWCLPVYNIITIIKSILILLEKTQGVHLIYRNTDLNHSLAAQEYAELIKNIIERSGHRSSFTDVGLITERERIDLYNQADIVISLSHSDGTPLSVLEAMAMRKIVVCGKSPYTESLIKHGVNGFLVDKDNPDHVAEQLGCIIDNFEYVESNVTVAARSFVEEHADIEKEVPEYISCFRDLMRNRCSD